MKLRMGLGLMVLPLLAAACSSSLDDPERRPALAVIRGQLTNPTSVAVSDAENVRVALVWNLRYVTNNTIKVAQDVKVSASFPSKFQLELTEPPPEESIQRVVATLPTEDQDEKIVRTAWGALVAYVDSNHNGKLDLVEPGATTTADQMLASNPQLTVVYHQWEGDPLPGRSSGYSLEQEPVEECRFEYLDGINWAPGWEPDLSTCRGGTEIPIDTEIELPVTDKLGAVSGACNAYNARSLASKPGFGAKKPDEVFPVAPGAEGYPTKDKNPLTFCAPDGSYYIVADCTITSHGLCEAPTRSCVTHGYTKPEGAVPAEWPCD
jgi:hypothetical protein